MVGNGVAGATAALVAQSRCGETRTVCSVALPVVSTSDRAGYGTFYLPVVTDAERGAFLDELERIAHDDGRVAPNRTYLGALLDSLDAVFEDVAQAANVSRANVLNFDVETMPCTAVCSCETEVAGLGQVADCDALGGWYQEAGCCSAPDASTLHLHNFSRFAPTYEQLAGTWRNGGVFNLVKSEASDAGRTCHQPDHSDAVTIAAYTARARAAVAMHAFDEVTGVTEEGDGTWTLAGGERDYAAQRVVFAVGGHGAHLSEAELLAYYGARHVHSWPSATSRVLLDAASYAGWQMGPNDAWGLSHYAGMQPAWFLWQDAATFVAPHGAQAWRLVFDESLSYHRRQQAMAAANVTEGVLIFRSAEGSLLADALVAIGVASEASKDAVASQVQAAIALDDVPKSCDSASKRYWRNAPTLCGYDAFYPSPRPDFGVADAARCSERVAPGEKVVALPLAAGIIDTTYGPSIDPETARVRSAPTAYAIGNAAAPLLSHAYLSPGSTLGNAMLGGVLAARDACDSLP